MADELTMSASLAYSDSEDTEAEIAFTDLLKTVTVKKITKLKQAVGTSEEAIVLGDVSAVGYSMFVNRDPTNYIDLKVATGGAIFARLDPNGGFLFGKLGSGAQVPYAIANTAACQMDVFIAST